MHLFEILKNQTDFLAIERLVISQLGRADQIGLIAFVDRARLRRCDRMQHFEQRLNGEIVFLNHSLRARAHRLLTIKARLISGNEDNRCERMFAHPHHILFHRNRIGAVYVEQDKIDVLRPHPVRKIV